MQNEQLDRMAAMAVMKWQYLQDGSELGYPGVYLGTKDSRTPDDCPVIETDWSPTTNEAHAAIVREKMRAEGWEITTVSSKRGDAVTIRNGRIDYTWSAQAGQMPLAMTRAAVMAKRLEKEG